MTNQLPAAQARDLLNRQELVTRLADALPCDGINESLEGVRLIRASAPTEPVYGVCEPAFCVIAQGGKRVYLGEEELSYDPYSYLLTTMKLPLIGQVSEASAEEPYLAIMMSIDTALISEVAMTMPAQRGSAGETERSVAVSPLDSELLDATTRLTRLISNPADQALMLPMVAKEIVYRLLQGPQRDQLLQMALADSHSHRIGQVIADIRDNLTRVLHIPTLASRAGMSVSSFHHHFKTATAMSPIQYQKQLRLQEARRLMLSQYLDAAKAGYEVGYEDPSHFSRDYKRLFGTPPMRDIERLRSACADN